MTDSSSSSYVSGIGAWIIRGTESLSVWGRSALKRCAKVCQFFMPPHLEGTEYDFRRAKPVFEVQGRQNWNIYNAPNRLRSSTSMSV